MALTTEDIALLRDSLIAPLEASLKAEVSSVRDQISDLADRTARLERGVNAIETAPVPYGKPKTFVSASEWQSVTDPKRVKQGYQG